MSNFILHTKECLPTENYRLYARILGGLLLGNTDMHFKNFAMLHTQGGLRLTPSYDQVAASLYNYKTVALALGGATDLNLMTLKSKNIIALAKEFQISNAALEMLLKQLSQNKKNAKESIFSSEIGTPVLKDHLIKNMEQRWNGTFALIGQTLSKKL